MMTKNKPLFIAEVKTKSPFGFESTTPEEELFELANKCGDIVSIHTNPLWGGSFEKLEKYRKLTTKAILAKGLHRKWTEVMDAFQCGADFVLCVGDDVGRIPAGIATNDIWYEPLTLDHLKRHRYNFEYFVWNQRNLETGKPKTETFNQARELCPDIKLIQASLIRTKNDVHPDADGYIVGEHLSTFIS